MDNMTRWLALGERGLSSDSIALTTLGAHPSEYRMACWPHDSGDLRRCLLLLEAVPEAREKGLDVLAARYPQWAALAAIWDELEETLRDEIGETLPRFFGSAPRTGELMTEALGPTPV